MQELLQKFTFLPGMTDQVLRHLEQVITPLSFFLYMYICNIPLQMRWIIAV